MKIRDAFKTMPERIAGELEERLAVADSGRVLQYHLSFFDDCLRAILPHDFIVLCGRSGKGKTELGLSVARNNAKVGRNVHHFALEAAPKELERRTKYAMLAHIAFRMTGAPQCSRPGCKLSSYHPLRAHLNYKDWLLGRCEDIVGHSNTAVDRVITKLYGTLNTFYRTQDFDTKALCRGILEIASDTELVVVDHMHYVDIADENENRGLADLVKTLRDVSLRIGRAIILVAHFRKRDRAVKQLVPNLEDIHGTGNIGKVCTQAIAIEPASGVNEPEWWLSPTFMTVLKDRDGSPTNHVAVTHFNQQTKAYEDNYTLGRIAGAKWKPLQTLDGTTVKGEDPPIWASRHLPWSEADQMPKAAPQLPMFNADEPHAATDPRFT